MAKPIVVIKVDFDRLAVNGVSPNIGALLFELNERFAAKMPDYHVFTIPNDVYDEHRDLYQFQVFYEKDQQPISDAELRQLISDSLPTTH